MSEEWRRAPLGAVAHIEMGQSPPGDTYNVEGQGLPFLQGSAEFGPHHPIPVRWCSEPRKVAIPGDILVSIRAPVGDLNRADRETAVGRGLAIVRSADPHVLTDFLGLALEFAGSDMRQRSGGTMFDSINRASIASQPLLIPPLPEQHRIVDLISAVDSCVTTAKAVSDAVEGVLAAHLEESFGAPHPSSTTVGALAAMGSGSSWKADDEVPFPQAGTLPVIGITSTPARTRVVDASQRRYVRGLRTGVRTLTRNSLLLIRTNGNRARIGNVYRVPEAAIGHAFSAFQIAASLHDERDLPYLFWFLSTPSVQARISRAASGSTGLGNVSIRWLAQLRVPWPAEEERHRVAELADLLEATSRAAAKGRLATEATRAALLSDLISGDRAIPESYDRFLDDAA